MKCGKQIEMVTSMEIKEYKMNKLKIISSRPHIGQHISQIIAGFLSLREKGCLDFNIDVCYDKIIPFPVPHLVEAEIEGRRIAFDMCDGYGNIDAIKAYIDNVDYYFKRSFSTKSNMSYPKTIQQKIYPLGFNYHVTHLKNPIESIISINALLAGPTNLYYPIKQIVKMIRGYGRDRYYTQDKFEKMADYKKDNIKILYLTRLWENEEISVTRINLVRELKKHFKNHFIGGVDNKPYARKTCPDLIVSPDFTRRPNYLNTMHQSDICIGTTGLHESIGWKTGEYIAASRAIVHETFNYEVPGHFNEGKNYLEFETIDQCLENVNHLFENPDALYNMKLANQHYYESWLKPEKLIENALQTVRKSKT